MIITVYDPNSGRILKTVAASTKEDLLLNVNEGEIWIEGGYSKENFYIKNGKAVSLPEKPDYPCFFDYDNEVWIKDEALLWSNLRKARDQRLQRCDWTQVPDAPVDQAAWAVYRQELRDLPANTTDPLNPPWPTKPE